MDEIIIAGAGTGAKRHLTPEVENAIFESDIVISSPRFLHLIPKDKKIILLADINETFSKIQDEPGKILILVSGDAGLYSLLPIAKKFFANKKLRVLPGLSSIQILCARASEVWNDAKILSGHGRALNIGEFLNMVERNKIVIIFCDKKNSPAVIADKLTNFRDIELFIASNLGNEDEIFLRGKPSEFLDRKFPELSIILIKNHDIYTFDKLNLRDSDFFRENAIVMTNENIRAVIISKLNLGKNSLLWDIGAGSGSISINAALENLSMEVHAIEKNPAAVKLITRNAAKFHLHNIKIHEGLASEIIKNLPAPSQIFIGGSGGEMSKIFHEITKLKRPVRVVAACVTLENFNEAYTIMKTRKNFETTQISVTSSRPLNEELTLMKANNPVVILCADF